MASLLRKLFAKKQPDKQGQGIDSPVAAYDPHAGASYSPNMIPQRETAERYAAPDVDPVCSEFLVGRSYDSVNGQTYQILADKCTVVDYSIEKDPDKKPLVVVCTTGKNKGKVSCRSRFGSITPHSRRIGGSSFDLLPNKRAGEVAVREMPYLVTSDLYMVIGQRQGTYVALVVATGELCFLNAYFKRV